MILLQGMVFLIFVLFQTCYIIFLFMTKMYNHPLILFLYVIILFILLLFCLYYWDTNCDYLLVFVCFFFFLKLPVLLALIYFTVTVL